MPVFFALHGCGRMDIYGLPMLRLGPISALVRSDAPKTYHWY